MEVKKYQIANEYLKIEALNYGGIITKIITKDINNQDIDVVLGYDNVEEYYTNDGYFGSLIGRCCNRIGKGKFTLDGKEYQLYCNNGVNSLHGGLEGFNTKYFDVAEEKNKLIFHYYSKENEENYPGDLDVYVTYELIKNTLVIEYKATTSSKTICNLTNHTYFNLDGKDDILDTYMQIDSNSICEIDETLIPTSKLMDVSGTCFDFRNMKKIRDGINSLDPQIQIAGGYDHNYCFDNGVRCFAYSDVSKILLEVKSNMPGVQFYSGNFITERVGKNHKIYNKNSGFCLETQLYPNSINIDTFPSVVIERNHPYYHRTTYTFTVKK